MLFECNTRDMMLDMVNKFRQIEIQFAEAMGDKEKLQFVADGIMKSNKSLRPTFFDRRFC